VSKHRRRVSKAAAGAAPAELAALRAENARLRERVEQIQRFADQALWLIYVRDLDSGDLVYVNDRFEELLGYSRAELLAPGFDFLALVAPDWQDMVRTSRAMHERGEEHLPFEFEMLSRDGRQVQVMLNSWVGCFEGRRAVVGFISDISSHHRLAGELHRALQRAVEAADQLRRAKEELERQNVELRALDRLKDGLLRDVSHELKTPVAKEAMQIEILRAQLGPEPDPAVIKTLAVMEQGVRRQQRVIRNLLDLARLESGRRIFCIGPVRVDEVLSRVLEDYRPTLEAAAIAVSVRSEPVAVSADEEMLWHVLSNLVNNAVKFAAREGPRRLETSVRAEGERAVVRIADNGIGLDAEEQRRAFERFYQASASIEGSGVGLSICRSLMEGMGGAIALESPGRGAGAVATVSLPL
jgi:PAS domain S-box-containing protein